MRTTSGRKQAGGGRRLVVLALAIAPAVLACAGPRRAVTLPARGSISSDADAQVSNALEAIVTGDAKGNQNDSLFSPAGTVIANGTLRFRPPRLAGVQLGGESAITSTQINVRENMAWGSVEYRWFSTDLNQVRVGRATIILVPRPAGGWWVDQLHSSTSR